MKSDGETQPAPKPKLVFNLRVIFYVVSLLAAGLAFSPGTIVASCFVLLFWFCCFAAVRSNSSGKTLALVVVSALLFMCCAGMLLPAVSSVREAARRTACLNNMRQLCLALLNYESANSNFPEASGVVQGNPCSWRVLILPFIEQSNLYNTYDFSKSWNSPANNLLTKIAIEGMTCPSADHSPKTTYKLVTGPGTFFEAGVPGTYGRITDGTSNTIIMIEDHANPVFWSDPNGDISIDEAVKLLSSLKPKDSIHKHEQMFQTTYVGTHVGLADGSVYRIGFGADPEQLRRAFLIADGSTLDIDSLGKPLVIVNYGAMVGASIYGFLILMPIVPLIREIRTRKTVRKTKPAAEP